MMETILKGDQKQWLLSKITDKNEALEEVAPPFTHVYFNLYDKDASAPNANATPDWDFKTQKLFDLFHFLISLAQVMGMTAEDVHEAYLKKNQVNHNRQDSGYSKKDEDDSRHI